MITSFFNRYCTFFDIGAVLTEKKCGAFYQKVGTFEGKGRQFLVKKCLVLGEKVYGFWDLANLGVKNGGENGWFSLHVDKIETFI